MYAIIKQCSKQNGAVSALTDELMCEKNEKWTWKSSFKIKRYETEEKALKALKKLSVKKIKVLPFKWVEELIEKQASFGELALDNK